jgi:hypothetical protein
MSLLVHWLLLCVGKLCENAPDVTAMALREQVCVVCMWLLMVWLRAVLQTGAGWGLREGTARKGGGLCAACVLAC